MKYLIDRTINEQNKLKYWYYFQWNMYYFQYYLIIDRIFQDDNVPLFDLKRFFHVYKHLRFNSKKRVYVYIYIKNINNE